MGNEDKIKNDYDIWLSSLNDNVKKIASKLFPWVKYRDIREIDDIGNRYSPRSYNEHEDGKITVDCIKYSDEMPWKSPIGIFGMNPEYLVEDKKLT